MHNSAFRRQRGELILYSCTQTWDALLWTKVATSWELWHAPDIAIEVPAVPEVAPQYLQP